MNANTCSRLFTEFGVLLISSLTAAPPPLPPGGSQTLNDTTNATFPEARGPVIRDELIPFEIRRPSDNAVLIAGKSQDRVVQNANGDLVFIPRLRDLVNPGGAAWITGVRCHGYGGVSVTTEFATDGSRQIGPDSVQRSAGGGDTLQQWNRPRNRESFTSRDQ